MEAKKFSSDDELIAWFEEELEKGNFVSVDNLEEIKQELAEAAERTLKQRELRVIFYSPEEKEKAFQILKKFFKFKLIEA